MSIDTLQILIDRYGLPLAIALFFIWIDVRRRKSDDDEKKNLLARVVELEKHQRTELTRLVVENTTAVQNHAEAARELKTSATEQASMFRTLCVALRTRTCLRETMAAIDEDRKQ